MRSVWLLFFVVAERYGVNLEGGSSRGVHPDERKNLDRFAPMMTKNDFGGKFGPGSDIRFFRSPYAAPEGHPVPGVRPLIH